MNEFAFAANTPEGERRTTAVGGAVAVVLLVLAWLVFDRLLALPSVWRWLLVVAVPFVGFSVVVRRLGRTTMGVYVLRLDGRHLSVVCPDETVMDVGEVRQVESERTAKVMNLKVNGSKDEVHLRARAASAWNGSSTEKDFNTLTKAVIALQEALAN